MAPKAAMQQAAMKVIKHMDKKATKATPKKSPMKASPSKLDKHNVGQLEADTGGQMTRQDKMRLLSDKMKQYQETKDFNFTYDETRCLYNRMNNAIRGPDNKMAKDVLDEIEGSGKGKEQKKRQLLKAWSSP